MMWSSEDDAKKSLKPGYWPDGMSCRRWEDRPPRRDMQQPRYRGHHHVAQCSGNI